MENLVNLIVNNGVAIVVVGYFLFTNYKFNEKLISTLTEITVTLKDIQDDLKGVKKNDVSRHQETD
jgi:hypothetical protein